MIQRGTVHPPAPVPEEEDALIMSIKLRSGRFESSISVPLFTTDAERQAFVESWFKMMEAGIKCGNEYRKNNPPMPPAKDA